MKIRILSGRLAGTVTDVPQTEADLAIQTGFGELVIEPAERRPEPRPEPVPEPDPEPVPQRTDAVMTDEQAKKARDEANAARYRRRYVGAGDP